MEVLLKKAERIPEGSVVSIRAGSTRRQAPLCFDQAFKFPTKKDMANPFKVDIFAPVGRARLVLRPDTDSYRVQLEMDGNDMGALEFEAKDAPELEGRPSRPQTPAPGMLPNEVDEKSSSPENRQLAATQAKVYLEEHGLLQYVQALLQSVIQEKPKNPFEYMIKQLQAGDTADRPVSPTKETAPAEAKETIAEKPKVEDKPKEPPKEAAKPAETPKVEEKPAEKPKVEEKPKEEAKVEEKPKEAPKEEMKPVEAPKVEEKPVEVPKTEEKPKEEAKVEAKPGDEQPVEVEQVRQTVKQNLIAASTAGDFDKFLAELPGNQAAVAAAKESAKDFLIKASEAGDIDKFLGELAQSKAEPPAAEEPPVKAPVEAPKEETTPPAVEEKPPGVEASKVEETPTEKPKAEEKPKEEPKEEAKPAEEPKVEEKPPVTEKPAEAPKEAPPPEPPTAQASPCDGDPPMDLDSIKDKVKESLIKASDAGEFDSFLCELPNTKPPAEKPDAEEKPMEAPKVEEKPAEKLQEEKPVAAEPAKAKPSTNGTKEHAKELLFKGHEDGTLQTILDSQKPPPSSASPDSKPAEKPVVEEKPDTKAGPSAIKEKAKANLVDGFSNGKLEQILGGKPKVEEKPTEAPKAEPKAEEEKPDEQVSLEAVKAKAAQCLDLGEQTGDLKILLKEEQSGQTAAAVPAPAASAVEQPMEMNIEEIKESVKMSLIKASEVGEFDKFLAELPVLLPLEEAKPKEEAKPVESPKEEVTPVEAPKEQAKPKEEAQPVEAPKEEATPVEAPKEEAKPPAVEEKPAALDKNAVRAKAEQALVRGASTGELKQLLVKDTKPAEAPKEEDKPAEAPKAPKEEDSGLPVVKQSSFDKAAEEGLQKEYVQNKMDENRRLYEDNEKLRLENQKLWSQLAETLKDGNQHIRDTNEKLRQENEDLKKRSATPDLLS